MADKFGFRRTVKGTQLRERQMSCHIDGTGTAAITDGGTDFGLTDSGTGDYDITFTQPFATGRAPHVYLQMITTARSGEPSAVTVSGCTVSTFAVDGTTATDADFYMWVVGWDSEDEV